MKEEYERLRDYQYKCLDIDPYTEIEWFRYDDEKNCIVNIMGLAVDGEEYYDLKSVTDLLNEYKNDIQSRKTTMGRMRRDIRILSSNRYK